MSGSTDTIKGMLTVKFKDREDSYSDQWNRVIMPKIMMVAAMILGMNWFHDSLSCVVKGPIDGGFATQACWIQGLYVFRELSHNTVDQKIAYYGIPKKFTHNGKYEDGRTCAKLTRSGKIDPDCHLMEKTYYNQYQWFPIYCAVLAFLFYLPYIFFRIVNSDIINLSHTVSGEEAPSKEKIDNVVSVFFNKDEVGKNKCQFMKIAGNIIVKCCYLLVNVLAFYITDVIFNGDFRRYGTKWMKMTQTENAEHHPYAKYRPSAKPSEVLLPTFGICEVTELGVDNKEVFENVHTVMCEISQHVLYHYVLAVTWFLLIAGIVISVVGVLLKLIDHLVTCTCFVLQGSEAWKVYKKLSLRECEYLECVRQKNAHFYSELVKQIKWDRCEEKGQTGGNYPVTPRPNAAAEYKPVNMYEMQPNGPMQGS